jgi:hypothetical protein
MQSMSDCRNVQSIVQLTVQFFFGGGRGNIYIYIYIYTVFNRITKVINTYIKQQGNKDISLWNTRKHFKRCRINVMDLDNKMKNS